MHLFQLLFLFTSLIPAFMFADTATEEKNSLREKIFTQSYASGIKNKSTKKPADSNIFRIVNEQPYIDFIQNFLKDHNIQSVVEIGCGDWRLSRYISWDKIRYQGIDIDKSVIEKNKQKYETPSISFIEADALSIDLPKADLLLCKDVLQHLPNEDIIDFLGKTHTYKHCLITHDVSFTDNPPDNNQIVVGGGHRTLDLDHSPFNAKGVKYFTYSSENLHKQIYYIRNQDDKLPSQKDEKTILLAILARNKAHTLPRYLACLDHFDYDKKLITVYVNTNNNTDNTLEILTDWIKKNTPLYKEIVFENVDVENVDQNTNEVQPHVWGAKRLKLLGSIRNKSMQMAKKHQCDFYFVIDCDNFILPHTLRELVKKDKPIIAPMLRSMPRKNHHTNFFADMHPLGYWQDDQDEQKILRNFVQGTFKVPVVHCTYLINTKHIDKLNYVDAIGSHEFIVFSNSARANGIDQYICNEKEFGTMYVPPHWEVSLKDELQDWKTIE